MPRPPQPNPQPSIQDVYRDLKAPDEVLSGVYATTIMISHSPAEFLMDFITRFFPTAVVSARVYVAASQVPRVLETLSKAMQGYVDRTRPPQAPPPPPQ